VSDLAECGIVYGKLVVKWHVSGGDFTCDMACDFACGRRGGSYLERDGFFYGWRLVGLGIGLEAVDLEWIWRIVGKVIWMEKDFFYPALGWVGLSWRYLVSSLVGLDCLREEPR